MTKPRTVDEYISQQPEAVRSILREIRARVLAAAPTAVEEIRYGMPAYRLASGHPVYFAAWAKHISLHDIPPLDEPEESEVAPLRRGKDTVRLPLSKPIPFDLIARVVRQLDGRA